MIFEHIYNKQVWYCIPTNTYFNIGSKVKKQFGTRGKSWRYQIIKPTKNNLTLLKLAGFYVPRYNLIHCFMFISEESAVNFLSYLRENYESYN